MATSKKFFKENLDRIPVGLGGIPADPERYALYAGLLALSKEIEDLHGSHRQVLQELRNIESLIRRL